MKRPPFVHASLTAVLLVAAAGCITDEAADLATVTAALEPENGGLSTDPETPPFGELIRVLGDRIRSVSDPLADDELIAHYRQAPGARTTRVALVWGQLPLASPPADYARDWSGALSIDRGAMIVHATIGLEDAPDRLLPRGEIDALALESHTQPHADGLILDIIDPDPAAGPLTLHYDGVDGTSAQVVLAELRDGPAVRVVDDQGSRFAVIPAP